MLDAKFFLKVGPNVRDRYRDHIFKKAKDVFGKSFKGYSKEYGIAKRANKFKRQARSYSNSTAPVLTSDLLRDFSLIRTSSGGFQLGWTTFGARVSQLAKRGRVLTTSSQPLPKAELRFLEVESDKYIKKGLGPNKTTRHKVGK